MRKRNKSDGFHCIFSHRFKTDKLINSILSNSGHPFFFFPSLERRNTAEPRAGRLTVILIQRPNTAAAPEREEDQVCVVLRSHQTGEANFLLDSLPLTAVWLAGGKQTYTPGNAFIRIRNTVTHSLVAL